MIKLAIVGYGKMGKDLESVIDRNKFLVAGKYDIDNKVQDSLKDIPDVAIDFSSPDSVIENVEFLSGKKINIVCGTTGWYDKLERVKKIIEKNGSGFVYASNFSLGMNIFFEIVKKSAELFKSFGQYDVAVEEIHHNQKKDTPSGTALAISRILKTHNISSLRVGSKFGDHKVLFDSPSDTISLEHSAKSRRGFAEGALLAAEFIQGKKGFYKFEDIFLTLNL